MSPALVLCQAFCTRNTHTKKMTHEKPTDLLRDLLPLHLCCPLFFIPIRLNNTLTVFSNGRLFHCLSTFSSLWLIWSVLLDSHFSCVPHLSRLNKTSNASPWVFLYVHGKEERLDSHLGRETTPGNVRKSQESC